MQVGRGFTAARQRASRRAKALHPLLRAAGAQGRSGTCGLAGFYRRSATGLAARGCGVIPCLLACTDRHSAAGLMACNEGQQGFQNHAGLWRSKASQAAQQHPNLRYFISTFIQLAAEQSGDRQRREKGPPILTAEKGEHERAMELVKAIQLHCARHCEPRRQNGQ